MLCLGSVSLGQPGKIVPLHAAGESLALGDTDNIYSFADLEYVGSDLRPQFVTVHVRETELDQVAGRLNARFREMAGRRFVRLRSGPEAELHRRVPVGFVGLDLG